jgi:hypothetical protein
MYFSTLILTIIDNIYYNVNGDTGFIEYIIITILLTVNTMCINTNNLWFFNMFGNMMIIIYFLVVNDYYKFWFCSFSIMNISLNMVDTILYNRTLMRQDEESRNRTVIRNIIIITTATSIESSCECCICLDNIEQQTSGKLPVCGHIFHKECIDKWFEKDTTLRCPMCRLQY